MTVLELLESSQKRIGSPDRWCQNTLARDAKGASVPPFHPEAKCFCAQGATASFRLTSDFYGDVEQEADQELNVSAFALYEMGIVSVNDSLGFCAVHRVYDHAIQRVRRSR